jgi:hypothetical protein
MIDLALAAGFTLIAAAGAASNAPGWIWWEGEKPSATNFPPKTSLSASTFPAKRGVLSGNDWLTCEGKRGMEEMFARYTVNIPSAGKGDGTPGSAGAAAGAAAGKAGGTPGSAGAEYRLWCRKFWKHGPFRWRFGQGEWAPCTRDVSLMDSTDIRKYLCANWVYLGTVTLPAGPQEFELRLDAGEGEDAVACFDALS